MSDNLHNAIRIHHALATKASDYTKKQHVFRLQTADQAEYLFQTSDSKELTSWVETINFVCAAYSAPPLEGGVGSQKRFQRPLLPSTHTKLLLVGGGWCLLVRVSKKNVEKSLIKKYFALSLAISQYYNLYDFTTDCLDLKSQMFLN